MNFKRLIGNTRKIYDMAKFEPRQTGLDYKVWVSPDFPRHKARMKVEIKGTTVSFYINDNPEVCAGEGNLLNGREKKDIAQWIVLNKQPLLDYWDRKITTEQLEQQIRKI